MSWDAYYCITSPDHGWSTGEDGGVKPMYYDAAEFRRGTAHSASGNAMVVESFEDVFDPDLYLNTLGERLFVQFTSGANGFSREIIEVASWDAGTSTFTLTPHGFEYPVSPGDDVENRAFVVYYASVQYRESAANYATWPTMATYCERYGQSVGKPGFEATMKKWAMEQARAQTRALPDNPYAVYYSPGTFVGYSGTTGPKVSFQTTYPNPSFVAQDGWLSGSDWGEIGTQAMNYGVNHFVWYRPGFSGYNLSAIVTAITAMNTAYWTNLSVYSNMRCIADWDQNGVINSSDESKFATNWLARHIDTDFDNDGNPDVDPYGNPLPDEDDMATFRAAYELGVCGEATAIADCNGNGISDAAEIQGNPYLDFNLDGILDECQSCDADWCHNGTVEVPDIFCFLSDWFAYVPAARCFGGACGVPAIFAFLATWFSTGMGPCTP